MSAAEDELAFQLQHACRVPVNVERQHRFHPVRKWRADFALSRAGMEKPLLVEVDGVIRGKPGAHQRVDGVASDCERQAEAMIAGFRMLRVTPAQVRSGQALKWIEALLA